MTFEAIRSVVDMSDDELDTANRLLEQLDDRRPRNELRAQIYDGKRAVRQISTVVPPQYHRIGLVLGWIPKGIDALTRRCTLERFTWADGDLDSLGARDVFDDNALRSELNSAITSTAIHAVSFLVNVQGEDDEPQSLILARDALNATGDWNVRTRRMDNLVSVTKFAEDRPVEFTLYLDNLTISAFKDRGVWKSIRSEHTWGVPVEALPYKPRLGRPFGSSRISRPAMSAQDAGVRELIRLEGHMDAFSFPELMLLGADAAVFKDEAGNTINSWAKMLGRIKGIPDDEDAANPRASVTQINASSPDPHLAALNAHAKTCARALSLPDDALAMTDVSNPTSAEAYDASQYELIAEAANAMDDWSVGVRRSFIRALAIQNGETDIPDEWKSIEAKWRNPKFLTRAAEADAGAKQVASVPWLAETEVGLELLGLTDDQIRRAVSERRRSVGTSNLASILERAAAGVTVASDNGEPTPADTTSDADDLKKKFDALGVAIRAGVDPVDAARRLGLEGVKFTGAVPVSLRVPEQEANALEDR